MKTYLFKTSKRTLSLGSQTLVMGIVNCTPDSFSDGGQYNTTEKAIAQALTFIQQGAHIIDIGGESTRPGSQPVSQKEELSRVIPVITALSKLTDIPLSIDTTKSEVARQAIAAGAEIINDISAFQFDPKMQEIAQKSGAGCILMHMRGTPQTMQQFCQYEDIINDMKLYFQKIIDQAVQAGINRQSLMLDPGIGFSKTTEQNLHLINHINEFSDLNLPLLLGTSRKSFIGKVLNQENPTQRIFGTAASVAIGIAKGVAVVRVHDVKEMLEVTKITNAILNSVNLKK